MLCISIYPSIYLPIYLPTYLPIYLSIYLSIYLLSTYLSTYLSNPTLPYPTLPYPILSIAKYIHPSMDIHGSFGMANVMQVLVQAGQTEGHSFLSLVHFNPETPTAVSCSPDLPTWSISSMKGSTDCPNISQYFLT